MVWVTLFEVLFWNDMVDWAKDWKIIFFLTLIVFLIWIEGHEASKKKEITKMMAKSIK